MRIASIVLAILALTGCAGRHYAVCMQAGAGSGCSHQRFTAKEAHKIGELLAAQPISEDIQVWVIDDRKHKVEPKSEAIPEPEPQNGDNKI